MEFWTQGLGLRGLGFRVHQPRKLGFFFFKVQWPLCLRSDVRACSKQACTLSIKTQAMRDAHMSEVQTK